LSLLLRSSTAHLRRHPWQLALALLGIALGVAVTIAVDLAVGSAHRAFEISTSAVTGRATHQITGASTGLDEQLYRTLRIDEGVRSIAPVVDGYVRRGARTLQLVGVDPFAEGPFRSYAIGNGPGSGLTPLLVGQGAFITSEQTAQVLRIAPGDSLVVSVAGGARTLVLVGTIRPADELSARALENLLVADISTAQETLGMIGRISRIDVAVPAGAAGTALLNRIKSKLPPDATISDARARTRQVTQLTRAFSLNLTALSLLTLMFGMFLIYNSMTFSVVQRRELFGILRALGVTRREIFRIVLTEAALMGLVGTLLGIIIGVLLGTQLVRLVTRTINDLYFVVAVRGLYFSPSTLIKGLALGIGATLVAALLPAYEATRAAPRNALSRATLESRVRQMLPRLTILGVALLAVGALVLLVLPRVLAASFAGIFILVLGASLLVPGVTLLMMRALRPLLGRTTGMLGRMAAASVGATLSRTGPAIAALAVSIAVGLAVAVMITSFRNTVVDWLGHTLQADIYISAPGFSSNRSDVTMEPRVVAEVQRTPGVSATSIYRNVVVQAPGGVPVRLLALHFAPQHGKTFRFKEGRAQDVWRAYRDSGQVIVTEPFAYRNNTHRGRLVTLLTPEGPRTFMIAGVLYDYASELGVVFMDLAEYRRHWNDDGVTSLAAFVDAGTNVDTVMQRIRERTAATQMLLVRPNRALRSASLEVFDRTFAITAVLRVLAVIVAFIGVLSALMALQLERAREIGVMRATGMTPAQVRVLVIMQTGLMGLAAGLLSIPIGAGLAALMVFVVNRRSFGWTLYMELPPTELAQALLLAIAAALLAGAYPAYRMSRTHPAAALRDE
jgi:putative ABC transport system permease protein